MSQDYETKRPDLRASRDESGNAGTAAEDPLVELARIVHKNKQSGANVSSGRVGSTDYFAGLEDVAADSAATPVRQEPSFSPAPVPAPTPVETRPLSEEIAEPEEAAPATPEVTPAVSSLEDLERAFEPQQTPAEDRPSHVSSLWPEIQTPDRAAAAEQPQAAPAAPVESRTETSYPGRTDRPAPFEPVAANDPTSLAPTLSVDLEQNLTAELEDELIGALRQSVDETQPPARVQDEAVEDVFEPAPRDAVPVEPYIEPERDPFRIETEAVRVSRPLEPVIPPVTDPAPQESVRAPVSRIISREEPATSFRANAKEEPVQREESRLAEPSVPVEPAKPQRPRIDENDFFAALNPVQDTPTTTRAYPAQEPAGDPAGIDALFADLDFPPPGERKAAAVEVPPHAAEEPAGDSDIDDMTWPAAASAVPQPEDDETPPPPEGYDLDAVARAMQESDPSLTGAGVLPPHSSAERDAVPQSKERSRRGLFVAAGVLGVAVLGAAGFFLVDGDAVVVPSGPPPVISGLQEPLKIYPDDTQAPANDQTAKLDYSRIDGTGVTGPDTLVLPESPQPAELPPAPAGTNGSADLVPGAPKRVRTVIVKPDGTFVTDEEPAAPAASAPSAPAVPAPAAPAAAASNDAPRTVSTTPIVSDNGSTPAETPAEPAAAQTPAIVAGAEDTPAEPAVAEPSQPLVTVLPRKKPAAPVQVASAPPATTTPAPAAQNDGPLNLSQQASAPAAAPAAPAASGTTGNIPSGTYIVQVTSQRSAAAASDAYSGLQRRFPSVLGNRNAVIVAANVEDRGVFYRARIPTGSRDEAISLCESLQAAGGDCFVRRQP